MTYLRFYNPYYAANRDQHTDSAYDHLMNRFNDSSYCGCKNLPAANITESEKEYQIEMALPGVDKDHIRIKHENGVLEVKVEKPEKETEKQYGRMEFDYSGTSRAFKTGEKIDTDQITARYENGILIIRLPKKEEHIRKPAQSITIE